jgi:acyl-CoA hydrolase
VEPRPVSASRSVLTHWMGPTDANVAGSVHGGAVMRLCDEAAATAAVRHCRQMVVTAAMGRMTFLLPIRLGQLLTFRASVNAVWRTSMEVGVRVEAEDIATGALQHTNSAYLTMVAVDATGSPFQVPPLLMEDEEDRRR